MRHVTGLILALAFLAPGAADAECAWVLWERVKVGAYEEWQPLDSYEKKKDCDRMSVRLAREMYENDPKRVVKYLACFPDTIDPRGPKGGGR